MSFFDLRRPLGWLFCTLGILLVIAGLLATPAAGARSLGININLIWGVVMIAFALVCLWLARREARRRTQAAGSSPK
jgi:FtsH-binding integral membrane protein